MNDSNKIIYLFELFILTAKVWDLLNWVANGLEPGSYGQGINLGEANRRTGEGYKAAYARAKQMREQQFANRAADSAPGPAEEVMKETYQVTCSLAAAISEI